MCFFKFLPTENSVIKSYLGHFHNSLHGRALNNYFQSLKQNKRESRIKKFAYTSIQSMLKKKKREEIACPTASTVSGIQELSKCLLKD